MPLRLGSRLFLGVGIGTALGRPRPAIGDQPCADILLADPALRDDVGRVGLGRKRRRRARGRAATGRNAVRARMPQVHRSPLGAAGFLRGRRLRCRRQPPCSPCASKARAARDRLDRAYRPILGHFGFGGSARLELAERSARRLAQEPCALSNRRRHHDIRSDRPEPDAASRRLCRLGDALATGGSPAVCVWHLRLRRRPFRFGDARRGGWLTGSDRGRYAFVVFTDDTSRTPESDRRLAPADRRRQTGRARCASPHPTGLPRRCAPAIRPRRPGSAGQDVRIERNEIDRLGGLALQHLGHHLARDGLDHDTVALADMRRGLRR